MDDIHFEILNHIREKSLNSAAHRSDFYDRTGHLLEYHHAIDELISLNYLRELPCSDVLVMVEPDGLVALLTEKALRSSTRKENIRYIITTAIAVFSLIISLVSIILQY